MEKWLPIVIIAILAGATAYGTTNYFKSGPEQDPNKYFGGKKTRHRKHKKRKNTRRK
jgi:hypothetical protein